MKPLILQLPPFSCYFTPLWSKYSPRSKFFFFWKRWCWREEIARPLCNSSVHCRVQKEELATGSCQSACPSAMPHHIMPNPESGVSPIFGCPRLLIQYIRSSLHFWTPSSQSTT
jgi:hypothetical protein